MSRRLLRVRVLGVTLPTVEQDDGDDAPNVGDCTTQPIGFAPRPGLPVPEQCEPYA